MNRKRLLAVIAVCFLLAAGIVTAATFDFTEEWTGVGTDVEHLHHGEGYWIDEDCNVRNGTGTLVFSGDGNFKSWDNEATNEFVCPGQSTNAYNITTDGTVTQIVSIGGLDHSYTAIVGRDYVFSTPDFGAGGIPQEIKKYDKDGNLVETRGVSLGALDSNNDYIDIEGSYGDDGKIDYVVVSFKETSVFKGENMTELQWAKNYGTDSGDAGANDREELEIAANGNVLLYESDTSTLRELDIETGAVEHNVSVPTLHSIDVDAETGNVYGSNTSNITVFDPDDYSIVGTLDVSAYSGGGSGTHATGGDYQGTPRIAYENAVLEVATLGNTLELDADAHMEHGATQFYTVTLVNDTRNDVTASANVSSSNSTIVSVDEANNELIATSNEQINGEVRITAEYNGLTATQNVTVANKSIDNLEILPPATWPSALFGGGGGTSPLGDTTGGNDIWPGAVQLQLIFLAISIGATVGWITDGNPWGALGAAQVILIGGWAMDYAADGFIIASLFACAFLALTASDVTIGGR